MLTLEKSLKVTRVNGKVSGNYSKVKEGDIITVKFDVMGNGGYSPKVDIYINGVYNHTPYARSFNEMFFVGKETYADGYGFIRSRPVFETTEEEN